MKSKLLLVLGLLLVLTPVSVTWAQVIKIDGNPPVVAQRGDLPKRGMSQKQVRSKYGEPVQRKAPVGKPPISSWQYPDFTVYFEGPWVLHTVVTAQ